MLGRVGNVLGKVVILYLGGEAGGKSAGVKQGDGRDAGFAGQEPLPDRFQIMPERRDPTHPCDDNTFTHENSGSWKLETGS